MADIERSLRLDTIRVPKGELVDKITSNRAKHIQEYEEAVDGYRDMVFVEYDKYLSKIKSALDQVKNTDIPIENIKLYFKHPDLPKPESHEDEYSTVLGMLSMTIDDYIDITTSDYRQYIEDNWSWTESFTTSNTRYKK